MAKYSRLIAGILISAPLWGYQCPDRDPGNTMTPEKQRRFYTLHEGDDMLPASWLRTLEVWDTGDKVVNNAAGKPLKFLDLENLIRYGLIKNPLPPTNGEETSGVIGLSIGNGNLGVNCAACHVNQIKIGEKVTPILDGAPSRFDIDKFANEMYSSLAHGCTLTKLGGCLDRLLTLSTSSLRDLLDATARGKLEAQLKFLAGAAVLDVTAHPYPFGPGRIDDFGGARDVLWGSATMKNAVPLVGPSSFLDLWSFQNAQWIHWDLNMNSTFDRNLGQAITGGAAYGGNKFMAAHTPKDDKVGPISVNVCNIAELESIAELMTAPIWPENTQPELVKLGEALFGQHCVECHRQTLSDRTVRYSDVGTDPNRALVYWLPMDQGKDFLTVAPPDLLALKKQIFDFGPVKFPQDSEGRVAGIDSKGNDAKWQQTYGYVPRPLKGIWASPPYLHNGSILTLTEVLDSKSRHYPDTFQLGHQDFDPVNVGYIRKDCIPGDHEHFCFDTRLPGNSNQGHPYGDTLTPLERQQVVEYLKTR